MKESKLKLLFLLLVFQFNFALNEKEDVDDIYQLDSSERGKNVVSIDQRIRDLLEECHLAPGKQIEANISLPEGARLDYGEHIFEKIRELVPEFIEAVDTAYKFVATENRQHFLSTISVVIDCGLRRNHRQSNILGQFLIDIPSNQININSKLMETLQSVFLQSREVICGETPVSFTIQIQPPPGSSSAYEKMLFDSLKRQLKVLPPCEVRNTIDQKVFRNSDGTLSKIEYLINLSRYTLQDVENFVIDLRESEADYSRILHRLFSKYLSEKFCTQKNILVKLPRDTAHLLIENVIQLTQSLFSSVNNRTHFKVDWPFQNDYELNFTMNCGISKELNTVDGELILNVSMPEVTIASALRTMLTDVLPEIKKELNLTNFAQINFIMKTPSNQEQSYATYAEKELKADLHQYFTDSEINLNFQPHINSRGILTDIRFEVFLKRFIIDGNFLRNEIIFPVDLARRDINIIFEFRNALVNLLPRIKIDSRVSTESFTISIKLPESSNAKLIGTIQAILMDQLRMYFPHHAISVDSKTDSTLILLNVKLQPFQAGIFYYSIERAVINLSEPGASLEPELKRYLLNILPNLQTTLRRGNQIYFDLKVIISGTLRPENIDEMRQQLLMILHKYLQNIEIEIKLKSEGPADITFKVDVYTKTESGLYPYPSFYEINLQEPGADLTNDLNLLILKLFPRFRKVSDRRIPFHITVDLILPQYSSVQFVNWTEEKVTQIIINHFPQCFLLTDVNSRQNSLGNIVNTKFEILIQPEKTSLHLQRTPDWKSFSLDLMKSRQTIVDELEIWLRNLLPGCSNNLKSGVSIGFHFKVKPFYGSRKEHLVILSTIILSTVIKNFPSHRIDTRRSDVQDDEGNIKHATIDVIIQPGRRYEDFEKIYYPESFHLKLFQSSTSVNSEMLRVIPQIFQKIRNISDVDILHVIQFTIEPPHNLKENYVHALSSKIIDQISEYFPEYFVESDTKGIKGDNDNIKEVNLVVALKPGKISLGDISAEKITDILEIPVPKNDEKPILLIGQWLETNIVNMWIKLKTEPVALKFSLHPLMSRSGYKILSGEIMEIIFNLFHHCNIRLQASGIEVKNDFLSHVTFVVTIEQRPRIPFSVVPPEINHWEMYTTRRLNKPTEEFSQLDSYEKENETTKFEATGITKWKITNLTESDSSVIIKPSKIYEGESHTLSPTDKGESKIPTISDSIKIIESPEIKYNENYEPLELNKWEIINPPQMNYDANHEPIVTDTWAVKNLLGSQMFEKTKPAEIHNWEIKGSPTTNKGETTNSSVPDSLSRLIYPLETSQPLDVNNDKTYEPISMDNCEAIHSSVSHPLVLSKPPEINHWLIYKSPETNKWEITSPSKSYPLETIKLPEVNDDENYKPSLTDKLKAKNPSGLHSLEISKPPEINHWLIYRSPKTNKWEIINPPQMNYDRNHEPMVTDTWAVKNLLGSQMFEKTKPAEIHNWEIKGLPTTNKGKTTNSSVPDSLSRLIYPLETSQPLDVNNDKTYKPISMDNWKAIYSSVSHPLVLSKPPEINHWLIYRSPETNKWEITSPSKSYPLETIKLPEVNNDENYKPSLTDKLKAKNPSGLHSLEISKPPEINQWLIFKSPKTNKWEITKPLKSYPLEIIKPPEVNYNKNIEPGSTDELKTKNPSGLHPLEISKPPEINHWLIYRSPKTNKWEITRPSKSLGTIKLPEVNYDRNYEPGSKEELQAKTPSKSFLSEITNPPVVNYNENHEPGSMDKWKAKNPPGVHPLEISKQPENDHWLFYRSPKTNRWEIANPSESYPPEANYDKNFEPVSTNKWKVMNLSGSNQLEISKLPEIDHWLFFRSPKTNKWEITKPSKSYPLEIIKPPEVNYNKNIEPGSTDELKAKNPSGLHSLEISKPPEINHWLIYRSPKTNKWEITRPSKSYPLETIKLPELNYDENHEPGSMDKWGVKNTFGSHPLEISKQPDINHWEIYRSPVTNKWKTTNLSKPYPLVMIKPPEVTYDKNYEPASTDKWDAKISSYSHPLEISKQPEMNHWEIYRSPMTNKWTTNLSEPYPLDMIKLSEVNYDENYEPVLTDKRKFESSSSSHPRKISKRPEINHWEIYRSPISNKWETTNLSKPYPLDVVKLPEVNYDKNYEPASTDKWEIKNSSSSHPLEISKQPEINHWEIYRSPITNKWETTNLSKPYPLDMIKLPEVNYDKNYEPASADKWETKNSFNSYPLEISKPPEIDHWLIYRSPKTNKWEVTNPSESFSSEIITSPEVNYEENYEPASTDKLEAKNPTDSHPLEISKQPEINHWKIYRSPISNKWETANLSKPFPSDMIKLPEVNFDKNYEPASTDKWETNNSFSSHPLEISKPNEISHWLIYRSPKTDKWKITNPSESFPSEVITSPEVNYEPALTDKWKAKNLTDSHPLLISKRPQIHHWEIYRSPISNKLETTNLSKPYPLDMIKLPEVNYDKNYEPASTDKWKSENSSSSHPLEISKQPEINHWEIYRSPITNKWETTHLSKPYPSDMIKLPEEDYNKNYEPAPVDKWETKNSLSSHPLEISKPPEIDHWLIYRSPKTNKWEVKNPSQSFPSEIITPPEVNYEEKYEPVSTDKWKAKNLTDPHPLDKPKQPEFNHWETFTSLGTNTLENNYPSTSESSEMNKPLEINYDGNYEPVLPFKKKPESNLSKIIKRFGINYSGILKPLIINKWKATNPSETLEMNKSPEFKDNETYNSSVTKKWDNKNPSELNSLKMITPSLTVHDENHTPVSNLDKWKVANPSGSRILEITKSPKTYHWENFESPVMNKWENMNPSEMNHDENHKPVVTDKWIFTNPPGSQKLEINEPIGISEGKIHKSPTQDEWETANPIKSDSSEKLKPLEINYDPNYEPISTDNWGAINPSGPHMLEMIPESNNWESVKSPVMNRWENKNPSESESLGIINPSYDGNYKPFETHEWKDTNQPSLNVSEVTESSENQNWKENVLHSAKKEEMNPEMSQWVRNLQPKTNSPSNITISPISLVIKPEDVIEVLVVPKLREYFLDIIAALKVGHLCFVPYLLQFPESTDQENLKGIEQTIANIFESHFPNNLVHSILDIKEKNENVINSGEIKILIRPVEEKKIFIDLTQGSLNISEILRREISLVEETLKLNLNHDKKACIIMNFMKSDIKPPKCMLDIIEAVTVVMERMFSDFEFHTTVDANDAKSIKIIITLKTPLWQESSENNHTDFIVTAGELEKSATQGIDSEFNTIYRIMKPVVDAGHKVVLIINMNLTQGSKETQMKNIIDYLRQIVENMFANAITGISPYVRRGSSNTISCIQLHVALELYIDSGTTHIENLMINLSNPLLIMKSEMDRHLPTITSTVQNYLSQKKSITFNLHILPPKRSTNLFLRTVTEVLVPQLTFPFCNYERKWKTSTNTDLEGFIIDLIVSITFESSDDSRTEMTQCEENIIIDLTRSDIRLKKELDRVLQTKYDEIQTILAQGKIQTLKFKLLPPSQRDNDYLRSMLHTLMEIVRNYFPYNKISDRIEASQTIEGYLSATIAIINIQPEIFPLPQPQIIIPLDILLGVSNSFHVKDSLNQYMSQIQALLARDPILFINFNIRPSRGAKDNYLEIISSEVINVMQKIFKTKIIHAMSKFAKNSRQEIFRITSFVVIS